MSIYLLFKFLKQYNSVNIYPTVNSFKSGKRNNKVTMETRSLCFMKLYKSVCGFFLSMIPPRDPLTTMEIQLGVSRNLKQCNSLFYIVHHSLFKVTLSFSGLQLRLAPLNFIQKLTPIRPIPPSASKRKSVYTSRKKTYSSMGISTNCFFQTGKILSKKEEKKEEIWSLTVLFIFLLLLNVNPALEQVKQKKPFYRMERKEYFIRLFDTYHTIFLLLLFYA